MSVVARQARRRWVVVAAGVLALASLPPLVSGAVSAVGSGAGSSIASTPRDLLEGALRSAEVAHVGLAESRGALAVPDLPRLGSVAEQLGQTTRLRVWWASPRAWRVDVPTATGEQDVYGGTRTVLWDYEDNRLTEVPAAPPLRLPRADDLLPPQAARRLLAGVGPQDRLDGIDGGRVGGRDTVGLRVVPSDPRSTIGAIDVQLDAGTRLPLAVTVRDARARTAFEARFLEVELREPDPATVRPPRAPGARREVETTPDLVTRIDRQGPWRLPDGLAGLASSDPIVGGAATYGTGLVRFVVLPLSPRLGARILDAVRNGTAVEVPDGEARLVSTGPITVLAALGADRRHAYLICGLVTAELIADAARALLADPPPLRSS